MKGIKLLSVALALICSATATAYDFKVGGLCYNFNEDGQSVTVTYENSSSPRYSSLSGAVNIPSSVSYGGTIYSVISIGGRAFERCTGLTSVTISNSVTSIGNSAFYNCTSLTSVTIPNSVTEIGSNAFSGTAWYNNQPNGLVYAGLVAYKYKGTMPNGTAISLMAGTKGITDGAFSGCSGLTSVNIPNSVTTIGTEVFYQCTGLTCVTIGNSVTSIGGYAFSGCSGLTSVTIPNSVTSIGSSAFYGCSGLTSVTVGNSVTSIGEYAFKDCTKLAKVQWNAKSCSDCSAAPFSGSSNLTTFLFGSAVEQIPAYLCRYCSGLTSVTIPNSVTTIGDQAFRDCSGLTSVTVGNSVTSIGNYAFYGCSGLTSVTIPNSVISIGEYAFKDCTKLAKVQWNAKSCSAVSSSYHPFSGCTNLTTFVFGSEVEQIPAYLCYSRSGLTGVTIGNSVTSIGNYAFSYCSGLTSVTVGNSVTSIGEYAFSYCSGLTSVTVGNSVTSIGEYAFKDCTKLAKVQWNAKACSAVSSSYHPFSGCTNLTTFVFGSEVEQIPSNLCSDCSSLTSVTIPNSVTTIGSSAFSGCSGLTSVIIPNSVTSIGRTAFSGCSGLTSVTIPNSVISIGQSAFSYCSGLTSVTLTGKGAWGAMAYIPVSQITTLNIGSEITSLGSLGVAPTTINCYAVVPPTCESGTFSNYDGSLHIPSQSTTAYFTASYWQNFNNLSNDITSIVTLDRSTATMAQWDELTLKATVNPAGAALKWSTTNPAVATVDENGLVTTAIGVGECDIYATLADNDAVYASCRITASYSDITLALNKEDIELRIGGASQTLTLTITPDNTGLTPAWTSSDESVATVDANGVVTAVSPGECDITATVLNKTATCHVTVTNKVDITFDVTDATILPNEILMVYPTATPDVAVDLTVTSSAPSVVFARLVNRPNNAPAAGAPALPSTKAIQIIGVAAGTSTITVADTEGRVTPTTIKVKVLGAMTTSLEIEQAVTLCEGNTHRIAVTIAPEDASHQLSWRSSDETVATVSDDGVLTAVAAGTATITATTTDGSNLSATCEVTVNQQVNTDNALTASHVAVMTGEEFMVNVGMTNQAEITAVQCDVYLPEGLQFVTADGDYVVELNGERVSRNHTVSTSDRSDGGVRVLIASQTSKPITGTEGDLFTMTLIAPDGTPAGDYVIDICNIILSDVSANTYHAPAIEIGVAVSDFMPGDVNGDKTINVGDYVATANYILLKDPQPFIFAAADLDGNDQINVGDLVGVANLALHYEGAPAKQQSAKYEVLSFDVDRVSEQVFAIKTSGVAALQFDVTLPEGVTLTSASVAGHSAEVARTADGGYRVLVSSPAVRPISDDVVLTLDGPAEGYVLLHDILASDPTGAVTAFNDLVLPVGTTGIGDITVANGDDDTLYDLLGRRVVNPTPGIYVSNGKKILVK